MGKVSTLERRADHLQNQLDRHESSMGARDFISAERAALESAIACMRLKYAELEGMAQPLDVLRELVTFLEESGDFQGVQGAAASRKLTELLERASIALTDFDAAVKAGQEGKQNEESRGMRAAR